MLGFVELGFRIALEFEGSSSSVQTGSIILLWVVSSLNFVGSWIFMEARCVAIGFLEGKTKTHKCKGTRFHLRKVHYKENRFYKGINPSAL